MSDNQDPERHMPVVYMVIGAAILYALIALRGCLKHGIPEQQPDYGVLVRPSEYSVS